MDLRLSFTLSLAMASEACGARTGLKELPVDASTDVDICRQQPGLVNASSEIVRDTSGRYTVVISGTSVPLATGYHLFRTDQCIPGTIVDTDHARMIDFAPQPARGPGYSFTFVDSNLMRGVTYCYFVNPEPTHGCPNSYLILRATIP